MVHREAKPARFDRLVGEMGEWMQKQTTLASRGGGGHPRFAFQGKIYLFKSNHGELLRIGAKKNFNDLLIKNVAKYVKIDGEKLKELIDALHEVLCIGKFVAPKPPQATFQA